MASQSYEDLVVENMMLQQTVAKLTLELHTIKTKEVMVEQYEGVESVHVKMLLHKADNSLKALDVRANNALCIVQQDTLCRIIASASPTKSIQTLAQVFQWTMGSDYAGQFLQLVAAKPITKLKYDSL